MTETPPYVRPDVAALLQMLASMGAPPLEQLPLADARGAFVAIAGLVEAEPRPLAVIRDLTCPGPGGTIPLRLYDTRESRDAGPVVMFFHGGGWVIGDLETHHAFCTEVAFQLDLPVVAVDYRLAPEHAFPAAADDCIAAARWVGGSPAELGRKVSGLVTMGDSAGGNLSIVVANELTAHPAAAPMLAQVPFYPATDLSTDRPSYDQFADGYFLTRAGMDWFDQCYKPDLSDPRVNVFKADPAIGPASVLVTAGLDPLRDQGRAYGQALIGAGRDVTFVEARGVIHGFVNLRKALPSVSGDLTAIFTALKQLLTRIG